ncbi:MAG: Hsp20/alpha crystallin family protein [Bacillota bacterium]
MKNDHNDDVNFQFSKIFRGIGSFLDLITEMAENNRQEYRHKGNFSLNNDKDLKGMYNFSVKLGAIKDIESNRVDSINLNKKPEQIIDIFDEGDYFFVLLQVPQVKPEELTVTLKNCHTLVVKTHGQILYTREYSIPAAVTAEELRWNLNNGILEVYLYKLGR